MITGYPPYVGRTDSEIYENIRHFPVNFSEIQDKMSQEGFDLLQKMLQKDPAQRISLNEAMEHQFFKSVNVEQYFINPEYMINLKNFKFKSKVQEVFYKYFINQIVPQKHRNVIE